MSEVLADLKKLPAAERSDIKQKALRMKSQGVRS